jgi:hypothetical protein
MKLNKLLFAVPITLIALGFIQNKGLDEIIQPGDKVEKLADGFLFT